MFTYSVFWTMPLDVVELLEFLSIRHLLLMILFLWIARKVVGAAMNRGVIPEKAKHGVLAQSAAEELSASTQAKGCCVVANAEPCVPRGLVSYSNAPKAQPFDSGLCSGSFIMLHRPTDDPKRFLSGDYPYSEHMHGRKRLWEFRVQITPREEVEGDFFIGCEQDQHYPIGRVQRCVGDSVISALRRAAGAKGMHQSHGDDPATTEGECERPEIVFPLWVIDQLIVTPEGAQPPSLTDPNFDKLGQRKTDDRRAMAQTMTSLRFQPGTTYTLGFWCIAQFVDGIAWCSRAPTWGLVPEVTLSELGTHAPCYVTLYALKPRRLWKGKVAANDSRHLDSRKSYLWRTALWSSYMPPKPERMQELVSGGPHELHLASGAPHKGEKLRTKKARCCCGTA